MSTNHPKASFNLIDVFSGVGGFTLGFSRYCENESWSFSPRLMIDLDPEARQVMNRNHPEIPFLVADIATLSGQDVLRAAKMKEGEEVHVLVGGPPCQGFSRAGRRALDDPRNKLVLDYLRLVTEIRPMVAVMENVPMVTSSRHGNVMDEIVAALQRIGYSSFYDVLLSSDYGVPQHRKRAILIAYRSDLNKLPALPKRTHERFGNAADLLELQQRVRFEEHLHPYVSVEEAIGDLPSVEAGGGADVSSYSQGAFSEFQRWARRGSIAVFNHRARSHSKDYLDKVSVIREGGRNQDLPVQERFSDTYFSQAYARLSRHGIAQTITTHFGNPGSGRFLHYRDLRSLTVREAARIQSFRDNFVFSGTLSTQMRHVGNAVPPLMARALAQVIGEDLYRLRVSSDASHPNVFAATTALPEVKRRSKNVRSSRLESAISESLSRLGIRGLLRNYRGLPGCPDFVLRKARIALFIDGCFWHACDQCKRRVSSNSLYWSRKLKRARARDTLISTTLRMRGWWVLRIWEHDLRARYASAIGFISAVLAASAHPKHSLPSTVSL